MPEVEEFLTEEEVAEILKIGVRGVKTERLAGRLLYCICAGKVRITRAQLAQYQVSIVKCREQHLRPTLTKSPGRRASTSSGMTANALAAQAAIHRINERQKRRSKTS